MLFLVSGQALDMTNGSGVRVLVVRTAHVFMLYCPLLLCPEQIYMTVCNFTSRFCSGNLFLEHFINNLKGLLLYCQLQLLDIEPLLGS